MPAPPGESAQEKLERLRHRVNALLDRHWGDMWMHRYSAAAFTTLPLHILEDHHRRLLYLLRDELGVSEDSVSRLLSAYVDYMQQWESRRHRDAAIRLYS